MIKKSKTKKPTAKSSSKKPVASKFGRSVARSKPSSSKKKFTGKKFTGKRAKNKVAPKKVVKRKAKSANKSPLKIVKKKAKAPIKTAIKAAPVKAVVVESALLQIVRQALDDMKAVNVKVIDVVGKSDVADTLVIASGNSDRHVKSIADRVTEFSKRAGFRPLGIEGERDGEWVLVDLHDVIVHVMLPRVREFYRLEDLWDIAAANREAHGV